MAQAPGAGQAQDRRRPHPLPGARRPRAARAARRRCWPSCTSSSPRATPPPRRRAACGSTCATRRSASPACCVELLPDEPEVGGLLALCCSPTPGGRPGSTPPATSCSWPTRTAAAGTELAIEEGAALVDRGAAATAGARRSVPAAGRHRGLPRPQPVVRRRPTGTRSSSSTGCSHCGHRRPWCRSTTPSRSASATAPRPGCRSSMPSTGSTASTSGTPARADLLRRLDRPQDAAASYRAALGAGAVGRGASLPRTPPRRGGTIGRCRSTLSCRRPTSDDSGSMPSRRRSMRCCASTARQVERVPYETMWIHAGEPWGIDPADSIARVALQRPGRLLLPPERRVQRAARARWATTSPATSAGCTGRAARTSRC